MTESTERALDDPVRLERAASIVRTALERRRLAAYVRRVVSDAGDLTPEDAERLRALLGRKGGPE